MTAGARQSREGREDMAQPKVRTPRKGIKRGGQAETKVRMRKCVGPKKVTQRSKQRLGVLGKGGEKAVDSRTKVLGSDNLY